MQTGTYLKERINLFLLVAIIVATVALVGVSLYAQNTLQGVSQQYENASSELYQVEKQLQEKKDTLNALQEELNQTTADVEKFGTIYTQTRKELNETQKQLAETEEELSNARVTIANLEDEIDLLESDLNTTETELADLRDEHNALEDDYNTVCNWIEDNDNITTADNCDDVLEAEQ